MKTASTQLDGREGRRRRAWERKQQGWKQQDSAAACGVTPGAVSQWLTRGREQGVEGLRRHPAPGRQPRLTAEQVAQLPALLDQGASAYGFRGQVWTGKRGAEVIRRAFAVRYHPAHVSRLLHAVRPSVQRPRATQRNEAASQAWGQERWPAVEKKRATKGGRSSG
jgi:transposase